ncbi:MAG: hypothetical protein WKF79_10090 [Nocardioides sp.]
MTTTALGLAFCWPRPVLLVEADPTGGSGIFAGYFQGKVEPSAGLIDLALAHRQGTLAETLPQVVRSWPPSTVSLLSGIRSHDQARSLINLWEPLTSVLRDLRRNGQDVLVDAGRLGLAGWPAPLVMGADLTLLTARNTLPALAGARSWANGLRDSFENAGSAHCFGVLLVDEAGRWPKTPASKGGGVGVPRIRPYNERQVAKTLQVPVVASLPWAPEGADYYSHGAKPPRKWETSALARAYQAAAEAIRARLDANAAGLSEGWAATGTEGSDTW